MKINKALLWKDLLLYKIAIEMKMEDTVSMQFVYGKIGIEKYTFFRVRNTGHISKNNLKKFADAFGYQIDRYKY